MIKRIVTNLPENLEYEKALNIYCKTNNPNFLSKHIFYLMDLYVKSAVIQIDKFYGKEIFSKSNMNIVLTKSQILDLVFDQIERKLGTVRIRSSDEQILSSFNFIKPKNLIPSLNSRLNLVKFEGLDSNSKSIEICVNPYFFGFLLSYSILTFHTYSKFSETEVFDDVLRILEDKYGEDFISIFWEVVEAYNRGIELGRQRGDTEDESFLTELTNISGLPDSLNFEDVVYNPTIQHCLEIINEMTK